MSSDTAPSLYEEKVLIEAVVHDGRPTVRTTSTRRKDSRKLPQEEHIEHLRFADPLSAIAFAEDLIKVSEELLKQSSEPEAVAGE